MSTNRSSSPVANQATRAWLGSHTSWATRAVLAMKVVQNLRGARAELLLTAGGRLSRLRHRNLLAVTDVIEVDGLKLEVVRPMHDRTDKIDDWAICVQRAAQG